MQNASTQFEDNNAVSDWFGASFVLLHPQLQMLHRRGGFLAGEIELDFGTGIAGFVGKRLAKKLGIPLQPGEHELRVDIHHLDNGLHWSRCFDGRHTVLSIFKPIGNYSDGYWLEKTGPVGLKLTVDIIDSGWHWRVLGVSIFGLPIPLMLFPQSTAFKKIVDDHYQFHVDFSMPLIGRLLSYEGSLAFESQ